MIEVQADRSSFDRVARALEGEADGARLRADLTDGLHAALEPALGQARAALMASGGGLPHAGEPLRQAVAGGLKVEASVGGGVARAALLAMKTGMPRNFANAPKRLNARQFRRQVYGRDVWVTQVGAPGWFDNTTSAGQQRYRVAARRALENVADRIARRA